MTLVDLSQRVRQILYAAITEFIATGEPVGSRTLAKKYGLALSAATIRNVLSDLEEAGYLHQPHTSAGRVPTDQAFRFFINTLMRVRPLSCEQQSAIELRLQPHRAGDALLRASGRVLSELTGTAAIIVSPRPETRTLRQMRFIPTRPGELLAVLVLNDGSVENRFLEDNGAVTEADLTRLHNLLAEVIEGRTLEEVRSLCACQLADERVHVNTLRRRAFELGQQAVEGAGQAELLIEGQVRLLDSADLSDIERIKHLIVALEDRQLLLQLLDETIQAEQANVLVGREAGEFAGGSLSMVSAPYLDRGRVAGAIGVLGFVRMDYSTVVPMVAATAKAMSDAFERSSTSELSSRRE